MNLNYLIKRPIVTEKSMASSGNGVYAFEVDVKATKAQIKTAIQSLFGVEVLAVRTSISKALVRSTGRRRLPGMKTATKKAIVELKPGQTIKLFEVKG